MGYSPWGCKESDMSEQLTLALHFHYLYSWLSTLGSCAGVLIAGFGES